MQHRKTITDRHKRLGNDYDMTILYHQMLSGADGTTVVSCSILKRALHKVHRSPVKLLPFDPDTFESNDRNSCIPVT